VVRIIQSPKQQDNFNDHLGEKEIAKDGTFSVAYAENVLKSRFRLGEEVIAKDAYFSKDYYALFPSSYIFPSYILRTSLWNQN